MTDTTTRLEEGQRQSYLAALGIPLWSSRHDLPGAQPSQGLGFVAWLDHVSVLPDAVQASVAQPAVTPAARPEQSAVVAKTASTPVEPARLAAGELAPASRVYNTSSDAYPRFSCRVQLLAPGLWVVIALDDVPDLSAQEYRLLENLMQALGGDVSVDAGREHFRWPLSLNPAIPRDAGAAREALAAFLGRRRMGPDEKARWLVLGETLAAYVRTALPEHNVIAAPPLRELLANPVAKRALWQALHG